MRKQRIILTACFIFSMGILSAQTTRLEQSFGLIGNGSFIRGVARSVTPTATTEAKYTVRMIQFGLMYYPRMDLIQGTDVSLSIGAPVMLGYGFTYKYSSTDFDGTTTTTSEGIKGGHLAFSVPVVMDLNLGLHSAADETRRKFGVYVGAGYGYSFTRIRTSLGKVTYDGFDPVLRAGIRLGDSWERRLTLGFTMKGVSADHPKTYEFQLLKDL